MPRHSPEPMAEIAHELRLPLSHIKGFVSSLRRTDVTWDRETRRAFLAEIDTEADRLAQLIDSLLQPSGPRTCAGAPYCDPGRVIQGGLHRMRGLLGERPLHVEVEPSLPAFQMDLDGLERVLANLLENAVKYSPPGTPIGVSARLTPDGELELVVEDQGPGIPFEDRARIFDPFVRRQSDRETSLPGHGLGLAICRAIVQAQGGRIEVTDRPGGGARFSVYLSAHYAQRHPGGVARRS
jgi:two-component system sensor histidine kinase KdpD